MNDAQVTFIDKTQTSDSTKREFFLDKTEPLEIGLNIEEIYYCFFLRMTFVQFGIFPEALGYIT